MENLRKAQCDRHFVSFYSDRPSVSLFFKKIWYARRLGGIIRQLQGSLFLDWPTEPGKVIGFFRPYGQIYFFTNWSYCCRNVEFKCGMPTQERGILAGWHKVELLAVPLGSSSFIHPAYLMIAKNRILPRTYRFQPSCFDVLFELGRISSSRLSLSLACCCSQFCCEGAFAIVYALTRYHALLVL